MSVNIAAGGGPFLLTDCPFSEEVLEEVCLTKFKATKRPLFLRAGGGVVTDDL